MNNFILEDNFIKAIRENKKQLKDFYHKEIDNLFFNKLPYDGTNYYLSVQHPKKVCYDWNELKEQNILFKDIFNQNDDIIIPSIGVSRINGDISGKFFVSHKHLYDIDLNIYHYIVKHNDKCGMIIRNEYLKYEEDLIFGFKAKDKHIAFNFGDSVKDSFVFYSLNPKYTLKEWYDIKTKNIINNNYNVLDMNKQYALKQINKFIK